MAAVILPARLTRFQITAAAQQHVRRQPTMYPPPQDPVQDLVRPARRQGSGKPVGPARGGLPRQQDPSTVNIWSGKRMGGSHGPQRETRQRSEQRCNPRLDTGRTRGSDAGASTFCLYFAKGSCTEGAACQHLHRLPTSTDDARLAPQTDRDAFGRERLPGPAFDRRGGAGSMDRDSHTIYVHYGGAGLLPLPKLRPLLEADFGEWGPLQSIHIVADKTIAFVRYHWRSTAEFAKEAMHGQGLRGSKASEVLRCRWASDDPNPSAVATSKRGAEEALADAQAAAFERLPPEVKRARVSAAALAGGARVSAVAAKYPDTDAAYAETEAGGWMAASATDGAEYVEHACGGLQGCATSYQPAEGWNAGYASGGCSAAAAADCAGANVLRIHEEGQQSQRAVHKQRQQEPEQQQQQQDQRPHKSMAPPHGWPCQQAQQQPGVSLLNTDEGVPGTALTLLADYSSSNDEAEDGGGPQALLG